MQIKFTALITVCVCAMVLFTNAQVRLSPTTFDFGQVEIASSLNAVYAFTNTSGKNVYLLKVEAPQTVLYQKPMNAVPPGATDTFRLVFAPEKSGAFNESVKLYFSDSPEPRIVRFKGNIKVLDRVADIDCPTFDNKSAGTNVVLCNVRFSVIDEQTREPIPEAEVAVNRQQSRMYTLRMQSDGSMPVSMTAGSYGFGVSAAGYLPLKRQLNINRNTSHIVFELTKPTPVETPVVVTSEITEAKDSVALVQTINPDALPESQFAFNNIVFLIDVSSSMNTADRMPLLKQSMSELARRLRPGDRVAIVTYSDKARIARASAPVNDVNELLHIIAALTPNGGTSADKGLAMAHDVLVENYLHTGNNQLVVATDGDFTLKETDLKLFQNGQVNGQPLNICVAGFGNNQNAIRSLKKSTKRFNGRFIFIDKSGQATNALLEEVKKNSRK